MPAIIHLFSRFDGGWDGLGRKFLYHRRLVASFPVLMGEYLYFCRDSRLRHGKFRPITPYNFPELESAAFIDVTSALFRALMLNRPGILLYSPFVEIPFAQDGEKTASEPRGFRQKRLYKTCRRAFICRHVTPMLLYATREKNK